MPADALPVPFPSEESSSLATATWSHTWTDPLGRPMKSGTVSLTRLGRPAYRTDADLTDGTVSLPLADGTYKMVAVLFDADGQRSYDMATIIV